MLKLLIILVIVLGIIAVAQLARVQEHTRALRKTREEEISYADNRLNAFLMILWMAGFFISSIWLMVKYGNTLPRAASEHGESVDTLMDVNMVIIIAVFFVVNFLLFYFASKYYYRKDRKAKFFPHDNRLELIWTLVPSVVLAFIIIYGLKTWNKMTGEATADAIKVEVTSEQFKWYVRYPGEDGAFGQVNINLIDPGTQNLLGIVNADNIGNMLEGLDGKIEKEEAKIDSPEKVSLLPDSHVEAIKDKIYKLQRHKQRILDLRDYDEGGVKAWVACNDDVIPNPVELHLPVGKEVEFTFRSKDVIHSAYMPHFRAQMNTVPGVPTKFKMIPTITTAEMRAELQDPDFNYLLLCNKICGISHYNMHIPVIVETEEEYQQWLAGQPTYLAKEEPASEESAEPEDSETPEEEQTEIDQNTTAQVSEQ